MALTEAKLKKLHNKSGKDVELSDGDALSIRVSPKGAISFQYRYRWLGKPVRLKLGSYPCITLSDARAELVRLKSMLERGFDPRKQQHIIKSQNEKELTAEQGLTYWLENHSKENRSDHAQVVRWFETYIYPFVGSMALNAMEVEHWELALESKKIEPYPVLRGKLLQLVKSVLRYLKKKRKADCQVLDLITVEDVGAQPKKGKRYLLNHELSKVWRFVNNDPTLIQNANRRQVSERNKLIVKLMMVFGDRTKELRTAKKSDFDLVNNIWTVDKSKNGEQIIRPIHPKIKPDIERLINMFPKTEILLPPLNNTASEIPVSGKSLVQVPEPFCTRLFLDHWNMHDLRRTIDTHMSDLGVDSDTTEKVLGHVVKGVKSHYKMSHLLDKQLAAYDLWITHLEGLK